VVNVPCLRKIPFQSTYTSDLSKPLCDVEGDEDGTIVNRFISFILIVNFLECSKSSEIIPTVAILRIMGI
jgi:hypothetical protein